MTNQILITDSGGNPKDWVNYETAAGYYTCGKVLWEIGEKVTTLHGGINREGEQSLLDISSIVGVSGPLLGDKFFKRESVWTDRYIMYARDQNLCAYCGQEFVNSKLTIDHVHPKSKGGKNIWTNTVTSCKPCNHRKGDRLLEECGMKLLYVPYAPNMFEKMILRNRNILADQMEFLKARVGKNSRLRTV